MKCSGCGHENRDAAKFCEECAAPLGRKCAGCGAELRPVAKFCDECALPVAGASPSRSVDPRSYTGLGDHAKALATANEAIEVSRRLGTRL
jgi:predicted amidophosphoribosyltransferase